ncbi:hypothetical protein QCA50_003792 [Cerrena zonata]|uniref:Uncharacterized protein n=1 Tax=Cerrena zonata TaxID=2478898 RepID=A0AAW0GHE1_9APHY
MQDTPAGLAEVFDDIIRYYDSVEKHFDEVAPLLRESPGIGRDHVLYKDWTSLRRKWYDTREDARFYARAFSELLRYGRDDLGSRMQMCSLPAKRQHLDKFIQDMRRQEQNIVTNMKHFCEIGRQIGTLSTRIRDTLQGKGIGGFFKKILTYLEWFAHYVIDLFDALGKVAYHYCSTDTSRTPLLKSLNFALKQVKVRNPTPGQVATEVERHAKEMRRMLKAYERAFDEWAIRCDMLSEIFDNVKSLPNAEYVLETIIGTIIGTTSRLNCDSLATCLHNFSNDHIAFPE